MMSRIAGAIGKPEKAIIVLENLLQSEGVEGSAAGLHAQSQLAVRAGDLAGAYALAQELLKSNRASSNISPGQDASG